MEGTVLYTLGAIYRYVNGFVKTDLAATIHGAHLLREIVCVHSHGSVQCSGERSVTGLKSSGDTSPVPPLPSFFPDGRRTSFPVGRHASRRSSFSRSSDSFQGPKSEDAPASLWVALTVLWAREGRLRGLFVGPVRTTDYCAGLASHNRRHCVCASFFRGKQFSV